VQAQQNHFIYLQTENKQPFYIKLDKKVYSSSISGYLIISKLQAGIYNFVVGFPKNEWPEQTILCALQDKDYGYLIKNYGEKGWGFFNLQTSNILMAQPSGQKYAVVTDTKSDSFANMLADVVNDPTIKQADPIKEPLKKVVKQEPKVSTSEKIIENSNEPIPLPVSLITKKSVRKTADGTDIIYLDNANGIIDTIKVFIPSNKEVAKNLPIKVVPDVKEEVKEEVKLVTVKEVPTQTDKTDTKFLPIDLPNPNVTTSKTSLDTIQQQVLKTSGMINSDCKNLASDEDFFKLRKKMVASSNTDEMITTAKKVFKIKCFTTDQVKNLGVLFLKDGDKYNFFDSAYPFVYDSSNFSSLQSQLTDTYYLDRFKVMIRH